MTNHREIIDNTNKIANKKIKKNKNRNKLHVHRTAQFLDLWNNKQQTFK